MLRRDMNEVTFYPPTGFTPCPKQGALLPAASVCVGVAGRVCVLSFTPGDASVERQGNRAFYVDGTDLADESTFVIPQGVIGPCPTDVGYVYANTPDGDAFVFVRMHVLDSPVAATYVIRIDKNGEAISLTPLHGVIGHADTDARVVAARYTGDGCVELATVRTAPNALAVLHHMYMPGTDVVAEVAGSKPIMYVPKDGEITPHIIMKTGVFMGSCVVIVTELTCYVGDFATGAFGPGYTCLDKKRVPSTSQEAWLNAVGDGISGGRGVVFNGAPHFFLDKAVSHVMYRIKGVEAHVCSKTNESFWMVTLEYPPCYVTCEYGCTGVTLIPVPVI